MNTRLYLGNLGYLAQKATTTVGTQGTKVLVMSGPGGVGKGTIIETALKRYHPHIFFSVSYTTRPPRMSEINGVHYHFTGRKTFDRMRKLGEFLECKEVHGEWYGTPLKPILDALYAGKFVIMEIDIEGSKEVRKQMPDACFIFLSASMETLTDRLAKRKLHTNEARSSAERRLARAPEELAQAHLFFAAHEIIESDTSEDAAESIELMTDRVMLHLEVHAEKHWVRNPKAVAA